jgi:hypothetical protein
MQDQNELTGNEAPPAAPPSLDQQLDALIFPMMNCMSRGITGSLAGMPMDRSLIAICRCMGRVVGMSFGAGDLGQLLRARKLCKDAFDTGVNSIKPQPAPQQPQGQTLPIPGQNR